MSLAGGSDRIVKLWDFSRSTRTREFETSVAKAQETLRTNPNHRASLAILGDWFAFRGADALAVELREKARTSGADVSSLALARCYWERGQVSAAAKEFQLAIERKVAPEDYFNLCRAAVKK